MGMQQRNEKYDNVMVTLHWVIGIGILLLGGLELLYQEFPRGHFIREGLRPIHQPLGTTLFVLICIRVTWRLLVARMPDALQGRSLSGIAAGLVHLALYVLMVGLPVLGMIYVFGNDKSVDFGLFKLALPLKGVLGDYAKSARWWHETLGIGILAVALLHAAAALFRHYVLKDGLIARMRLRAGRDKAASLQPAE
jgi:superoxide oxidase